MHQHAACLGVAISAFSTISPSINLTSCMQSAGSIDMFRLAAIYPFQFVCVIAASSIQH
ncbi:hypothetical protein GQ42DRAFT_163672 [Ramicandelaber brevisporus]|nr:hypothetical protein GQ42DRAFT_163672 [Ramicandelaber brevisporus]